MRYNFCRKYIDKPLYVDPIEAAEVLDNSMKKGRFKKRFGREVHIFLCSICGYWHIGNWGKIRKPDNDLKGQLTLFHFHGSGKVEYPKWVR